MKYLHQRGRSGFYLQPTRLQLSKSVTMFSHEWSAKKTCKHIRSHRNPRESASILLSSNFTFTQKAGWLFDMPLSAIRNIQKLKLLEADLEYAGYPELARILRWLSFCGNVSEDGRKQNTEWSQSVVILDTKGRWVVQRERYLHEEVQALEKSLVLSTDDDKEDMGASQRQLDAYKKELQCLNDEYNTLYRQIWQLEGDIPYGVIKRAFRAYRKDHNWYLCEWLRQDCAGRGGCCGRGCGCCERSRTTSKKPRHGWDHGHCTSACGCCIRTLGYPESDINKRRDIENFPFDIPAYQTHYSRRIFRAYIFGVSLGRLGYFLKKE